MKPAQTHWQRAIALIDMNAFFASVEQLDFPELRGQPVGITNGKQGTCIITCSYEARAHGIKTGMRLREAKSLCPHIIQCPARPSRYAELSTRIMETLYDITPDLEIFSVDEAFLDLTHCQKLYGSAIKVAQMAKEKIFEVTGLPCSVGLSGDKTTSKFAAKLKKPNGFEVILPWEAKERLKNVPVTELCGIAKGIGRFLGQYGVYTCGDMEKLPISILSRRFGNIGRRIWYMCQGEDPEPIITHIPDPKSMGHGKVIPPNTMDKNILLTYFLHMSEKVARRLRRHEMQAQHFFIGLRAEDYGWIGCKERLASPTDDGQIIYRLCRQMLNLCWSGEPGFQVQVTALDPKPYAQQLDMFTIENKTRAKINTSMDEVNEKYGEFVVHPARLLKRSTMPNVIAPAWKPFGHRETIAA